MNRSGKLVTGAAAEDLSEREKAACEACLRQDLTLYPGESERDGATVWVLHDPLANRYFRLGGREVELLEFIGRAPLEQAARQASQELGRQVELQELEGLVEFLRRNNLVVGDGAQQAWYRHQLRLQRQPGWLARAARSYLFIRIPLWNPDPWLARTLPYVAWLGRRPALLALAMMGLVGLLLAVRQWDSFTATFLHFFTLEGIALYLLVLLLVKVLHELGHGYAAKAQGCRVPTIGVAFLVGWPVLYTDTSDAWKLPRRRQRLRIGAAGIGVELGIAALALLLWSLAPESAWRSAFFLLATSTWLLSLLVNVNPLMRFDGYYLLSDWLRLPSLEARSFALARWWLRETLFNLGVAPPEPLQRRMLLFAFAVWIYRFLLFLGIALLVYHFFFKAAGILLFAVEILYFILRPLGRELIEWWKVRHLMSWNRVTLRTLCLILLAVALGLVPWRGSIQAPAVLEGHYLQVFSRVPGEITRLGAQVGQRVAGGTILLETHSPELAFEVDQVERRYQELQWQRAALGLNEVMREEALIVASQLHTQSQRLHSLLRQQQQEVVRAPIAGTLVDRDPALAVGDWVGEGVPVMAILSDSEPDVTAYVDEAVLTRLAPGAAGRFYPEGGGWPALDVQLVEVDVAGLRQLDSRYAASRYGGGVAVREAEGERLLPASSVYRVRLRVTAWPFQPPRVIRGSVHLDAPAESLFSALKRRVIALYQRERGF